MCSGRDRHDENHGIFRLQDNQEPESGRQRHQCCSLAVKAKVQTVHEPERWIQPTSGCCHVILPSLFHVIEGLLDRHACVLID